MGNFSDSADILADEEVKTFFLGILDSRMTSEEKYEKFVQFFRKRSEIKSEILTHVDQLITADKEGVKKIVSRVGKELGTWDPERILDRTADSILRAVRRLRVSRYSDCGWGTT